MLTKPLASLLLTALLVASASLSSFAQPLMRQSRDIKLIGGGSLSGILAVTLIRDTHQSIRFLDLEQRRALEFPAPVSNAGFPSFSPNGDAITFVGTTRKGNEIFASSWGGENVSRVTFNSVNDGNPSFTVEGDAVIYFSELRRYKSEILSSLIAAPYTRTRLTKSTTPYGLPTATT